MNSDHKTRTVCVLCGQEEGHSPRCSVTRHGVDDAMFRSELGPVGPGTPAARMHATWTRMHEDEAEVERLTRYSPVSSKYPIEYAYVDAFRALRAEVERLREERDEYLRRVDATVVRAQRYETVLRLVRDELSNGVTANWEFIEQQFSLALDETHPKEDS